MMIHTMNNPLEKRADIDLVDGITQRDEPSLAEVYRRHGGPVYGLALRILRNPDLAEEIVQEVLLRLWREPHKFDPGRGSLRSFLLAHTHGRSVDVIRSESSRRTREERDALLTPESGWSLEEEVWEMALADHVRTALEELEEIERRPIELAYFGGLTYRQVAHLLDTPEGTIKSRIRTGLKRLNGALIRYGLAPVS
jgi:RNA polymerase sigma-70 factor (ECF subfamily)